MVSSVLHCSVARSSWNGLFCAIALFSSLVLAGCDAGTTSPETETTVALQLSTPLLALAAGDTGRISLAPSGRHRGAARAPLEQC